MRTAGRRIRFSAVLVALAIGGLVVFAKPGLAQKPFYQGKTLTLMVDFSAGGPTDIECRLYARYLKNHLAGQPTIVIMNRPGAGGTLAMNWLYDRARRDGTVAGCQTASGRYQEWYVGDPQAVGLRANMAEIIPVMFSPIVSVGAIKTELPPGARIGRPEDILKAKDWIAGGFGVDSSKDLKFRAIFDLVGAKYRYVTGYPGSADLLAAFMRNEIHYVDGSTPLYLTRVKPIAVDKGQAIPIWYDSQVSVPRLEPAYKANEFVKKLSGKEASGPLWKLFAILRSYRQILFPPGVPRAAVEALRPAFEGLERDPKFLAEYIKMVGIEPIFLTDEREIEASIAPWKEAGQEMREFRLRYIEEGRKLLGQ